MARHYRPGGLGAMIDLYEDEIRDFLGFFHTINTEAYLLERPEQTEYLRSIQMIMRHIIRAAYGYANGIRSALGEPLTTEQPVELESPEEAARSLEEAFRYTEEGLLDKWGMTEEELDKTSMMATWGVPYSLEQMLEHAIVHIMRHKRQIQRILIK
jgi:uncharacterized damage-inducible protein DinB